MEYLPVTEITQSQREQAQNSDLYQRGDMRLVWVNESNLHSFSSMLGSSNKTKSCLTDLPNTPSPGLLMSMALRYDHALGIPGYYDDLPIQLGMSHDERLKSTLSMMRQLYEEISGQGFYRPEREAEYASKMSGELKVE
jgi:hypothetical protein